MKGTCAYWLFTAFVVPVCLGLGYLMALAGSPQQVWLFRDLLGWM